MTEDDNKFLDALLAENFFGMAFRLEITLTLARMQPKPLEWAEGFISRLHEKLDWHEARTSMPPDHHEAARACVDALARDLLQILRPQRP